MGNAARVYATIDQDVVMPNPIGEGFIPEWGGVEFDDNNWYNSTAKTLLTVPSGVTKAFFEFTGQINNLPSGAITLPVFHRLRSGVYLPWRGGSYECFTNNAVGTRMAQRVGPVAVLGGDSVRVHLVTLDSEGDAVSSGVLFSGAVDHKFFASFAAWAA